MQPTPWTPVLPSESARTPGCLSYGLFVAAGAWVALVTVVTQSVAWSFDQFSLLQGNMLPGWFWVVVAAVQALLLALPVVPLALTSRMPRLRATYQMWVLAIGFGLLLSLARLCPVTWTQPAAVLQITLALLATFGLTKLRTKNAELSKSPTVSQFSTAQRAPDSQFPILALAVALGLVVALPWLQAGALGSPLDTLLNLLAGLSLGLFAGVLLGGFLIGRLAAHTSEPALDIGFGGFAAGIALLILGAGFGFGGSQLPLLLCLAPLGGATASVGRFVWPDELAAGRAWPPIAGLVGVAAAAPLMFLDPDEFSLALDDAVGLPIRTALFAFLIACLLGLALWALSSRLAGPVRAGPAVGALGLIFVGALLSYFFAGQPGFYGEQLFVILRDQADLSAAPAIGDRDQRLSYVYTTLTQHANRTQAGLRATLDRLGVEHQPYYLVNAIEVNGGPFLRSYLAAQPEVDRILDSPHLRPLPAVAASGVGGERAPQEVQWNIRMIGADRVWAELGVNGQGIVVGESDSGVQGDHPALRDGYRGSGGQNDYNWLDPWNHTGAPNDAGGHGTHTTGTILGRNGIGVAPGAQWIGCVNLARNIGNPPFYLDCMQFMLAPYPQSGDPFKDGVPSLAAHVLNNSWGCPPLEGCDPNALVSAVRALRAAGIFVTASTGNEGPDCSSVRHPIAIYDEAFSVGAVDQFGNIAPFSSRGPVIVDGSGRIKPDIVAPGVEVLSSLPGNSYGATDGTSMAGPHVAGVVALMWSAQPKLIGEIDRTEQILIETARPYEGERSGCFESSVPSNGWGYGVVDAYAAVKAALAER